MGARLDFLYDGIECIMCGSLRWDGAPIVGELAPVVAEMATFEDLLEPYNVLMSAPPPRFEQHLEHMGKYDLVATCSRIGALTEEVALERQRAFLTWREKRLGRR